MATLPSPTVSTSIVKTRRNVAETDAPARAVHAAVPEHDPPQPAKTKPGAGLALSRRRVAFRGLAAHVVPQLIPAGELVTAPPPDRVTEIAARAGLPRVKRPETRAAASSATTQRAAAPVHAPPQPPNRAPRLVTAVTTAVRPTGASGEHGASQD
jgi:hypothetical protein